MVDTEIAVFLGQGRHAMGGQFVRAVRARMAHRVTALEALAVVALVAVPFLGVSSAPWPGWARDGFLFARPFLLVGLLLALLAVIDLGPTITALRMRRAV